MNRLIGALFVIYAICIVIALVFVTTIIPRPTPQSPEGLTIDIKAETIK